MTKSVRKVLYSKREIFACLPLLLYVIVLLWPQVKVVCRFDSVLYLIGQCREEVE